MVMSPLGLGTKNYCAGEGQPQFGSQSMLFVSVFFFLSFVTHTQFLFGLSAVKFARK
jgi:hypothetical protein